MHLHVGGLSQWWNHSTRVLHAPLAWIHDRCFPRLVKNRLFKTASDIDEPPFQFIFTMELIVVDTMLHDSPDLVIHHRTEIWAVWRATGWAQKFGVYWRSSSARTRRGVPVHCPSGTKSLFQTLCVSLAAAWHHYYVVQLNYHEDRLKRLKLPTLKYRRIGDIIEVYKILTNKYDSRMNLYIEKQQDSI